MEKSTQTSWAQGNLYSLHIIISYQTNMNYSELKFFFFFFHFECPSFLPSYENTSPNQIAMKCYYDVIGSIQNDSTYEKLECSKCLFRCESFSRALYLCLSLIVSNSVHKTEKLQLKSIMPFLSIHPFAKVVFTRKLACSITLMWFMSNHYIHIYRSITSFRRFCVHFHLYLVMSSTEIELTNSDTNGMDFLRGRMSGILSMLL